METKKESLKDMFNKRSVLLPLATAAALLIGGVAGYSLSSRAQNDAAPARVMFAQSETDPATLKKAQQLYRNYLKSMGLGNKEVNIDPLTGYARYIPLDPQHPRRYLGYYILGELGVSCPALGCETLIFKDEGGGKWELVFQAFAHKIWIGDQPAQGGPRNIFTQSEYIDPRTGLGGNVYLWQWGGDQYVNAGVHQRRQELTPEFK